MSDDPRQTYIDTIEPRWADTVRDLDRAIMAGGPELNRRVAFGMLAYAPGWHGRAWVCGIGTSNRGIHVRFLYGALLDDPDGELRHGPGTLRTLDVAAPDLVDASLVAEFVREAVSKFDDFVTSSQQ